MGSVKVITDIAIRTQLTADYDSDIILRYRTFPEYMVENMSIVAVFSCFEHSWLSKASFWVWWSINGNVLSIKLTIDYGSNIILRYKWNFFHYTVENMSKIAVFSCFEAFMVFWYYFWVCWSYSWHCSKHELDCWLWFWQYFMM